MKLKDQVVFDFDGGIKDIIAPTRGDWYWIDGVVKQGKLDPAMIEIGPKAWEAIRLEEKSGPAFLQWEAFHGFYLWPHR